MTTLTKTREDILSEMNRLIDFAVNEGVIVPEKQHLIRTWLIFMDKSLSQYKEAIISEIEGLIESLEYKAMVSNGDLSFLKYRPTEIYNLALTYISLFKRRNMKEKPFYKWPIYIYDGKRKWYNPLRYILGKDFTGLTADIKKSRLWNMDLDVKDINFITDKQND